jgi:low affinity Fe/Cu permease
MGAGLKHLLTRLGVYTSSPVAFLVLILYAALWYLFKSETFEWHAGATLATWAMTLGIQRAEHRDTQAIHAKLDEVLHALGTRAMSLPGSMRKNLRRSSHDANTCARAISAPHGAGSPWELGKAWNV